MKKTPKYKVQEVVKIIHATNSDEAKGKRGRIVGTDLVQNPMGLTATDRDLYTIYYTLSVEEIHYPVYVEERYLEKCIPIKPLLAIRRKARRNGGQVAPGMRKHMQPQKPKEKKLYVIDAGMIQPAVQHGDISVEEAFEFMKQGYIVI